MSKYKILKDYEQTLMIVEDMLGPGVTTNIQLDMLGHLIFGSDYLGTYSSDQMPKSVKDNQCFILNTDSSRRKGTHWVAFSKSDGKIWYYDSFRRTKKALSKFRGNKRMYSANTTDRDQSMTEQNCGSRALSFLVIFSK